MKFSKATAVWVAVGLLTGILVTTSIRYLLIKPEETHYHANFALFINDVRDEFKGPGYYEEEQSCSSNDLDNPKTRVHMHDQNPGLVHVHAPTVTWGQFFDNLGYGVSDKAITTSSAVYVAGQDDNKLTFRINGQEVTGVANRIIKSDDVLLINYGLDDESKIAEHYNEVPRDAHAANSENDPATCRGNKPLTAKERLKKAIGF